MSKKLWKLVDAETKRQQETIDLIPSENIVEPEILGVLGTPLVNKYSEGYPMRRYYGGNEFCDQIELLAQEEGLKAFGLKGGLSTELSPAALKDEKFAQQNRWYLNVQAYSGSPANLAIYFALLKPGDAVMGLKLSEGGHLTHGFGLNFSGTFYKSVQYSLVPQTGEIDYAEMERLAIESKPRMIYSGATAYPRVIDFKRIGEIAKKVGAYHVADVSHIAGLVATGQHPSPFPYADVVMATTHKTMRGPRGAVIYARTPALAAAINKAIIPGVQGGPHNNQTAAIALMFEFMQQTKFKKYGAQIVKNAKVLAKELTSHGFNLVSGGTDNHLLLVDLKNKNMSGMDAEKLLDAAGLIANRNTVPGDEKPFNPSGIRMGTPSVTSRGMKEKEMKMIAGFIHRLIDGKEAPAKIRKEVLALCKKFPLPY
jgi:glycine hydroxymethyltransferase